MSAESKVSLWSLARARRAGRLLAFLRCLRWRRATLGHLPDALLRDIGVDRMDVELGGKKVRNDSPPRC